MSSQKKQLFDLLQKITTSKVEILESSNLKKDLNMDSVSLVQLAIQINDIFGVDLGEKFDQGFPIDTVKDLISCLEK